MASSKAWLAAMVGMVAIIAQTGSVGGATIALTGDPIGGDTWYSFSQAKINEDGAVSLSGEHSAFSPLIVGGMPGNLYMLGGKYRIPPAYNAPNSALNTTGINLAYRSINSTPSHVIRLATPGGAITDLAVQGGSAPDTAATYSSLNASVDFDHGTPVFQANLSDGGQGIWTGTSPTLLYRNGDAAPGTSATFTSFGAPNISATGTIAFSGATATSGGLWYDDGSGTVAVAYTGLADPDGENYSVSIPGGRQLLFGGSGLAGNQVAFCAYGNSSQKLKLYAGQPGSLAVLARTGDAAPGTSEAFATASPWGYDNPYKLATPVINAEGTVAFRGMLTGDTTQDTGIWSGDATGLELIAREGGSAPETGAVFAELSPTINLVLNPNGQLAFIASLTGAGVTASNDLGLFATSPTGNLKLIAREGDAYFVADGDYRTITGITLSGDSFASGGGYGELIYILRFGDGTSGVFAQLVPEPSAGLLLACGGLLLGKRNRRRN